MDIKRTKEANWLKHDTVRFCQLLQKAAAKHHAHRTENFSSNNAGGAREIRTGRMDANSPNVHAVDGVTFEIARGETLCLIGPNSVTFCTNLLSWRTRDKAAKTY